MTGKQLASLAHPARRAALERIAMGPASPDDIAKESGIALGVVAYHIRALAAADLICLDHEERRRGAVKHVYRLGAVGDLANDVRDVADAFNELALALAVSSEGTL